MLKNLKHMMGLRALKHVNAEGRNIVISNYHTANRIGAVYNAASEGDFILVKQFLKFLKSEYGIRNVMALAYVDDKVVPDYFLRAINQDWLLQKNLAWNFKPFGDSYSKFINEQFDILIDLTDGECLPLRFAQKESKAGFKVGKSGALNEDQFDMLIEIKSGDTFDTYLHKINHFLKVINQPKKEHEYEAV